MTGIVHPRLLASLTGFYPTTVSIERSTSTQSGTGQSTPVWSPVDDLQDIAASIAAVPAGDRQQAGGTFTVASHKIALRGHYPAITTQHQAVDASGQAWDIRDVQHDSQSVQTYLLVDRTKR